METKLKARAYDQLLAKLPMGIAILSSDLHYLSINPVLARFNGKSIEEHVGRHVKDVLPELYPVIGPMLEHVIQSGESLIDFTVKDDNERYGEAQDWLGSYIALRDERGHTDGILVVAINETEKQRHQREQQRDLERMRQVLNHMFAFAGVLDVDGTLLDANNPPLHQAGMTLADVQFRLFWECSWWSHDEEVSARIERAVLDARDGKISRFDTTAFMGDRVIDLDFMIAPMFNEGKLKYLIPSAIEITDRKEAELHLQESESRFKQVFDCAGDGLIAVDKEGHIKLLNARALEMFGYQTQELLGQRIERLVPEAVQIKHQQLSSNFLNTPSSRGMAIRQELFAKRKNGQLFPVEIGLTYLQNDPLVSVLATITDVTASKEIQANLQQSLEEKSALLTERTTLLNEVHHRVKNNLQIISSLLNLQARAASVQLQTALTESQLRVRAMALTHQMLYENKSFSGVTLAHYLKQLAHLLASSLFASPHIRFAIDELDESIEVDVDKTINCGLLVNEMITNSLKHAFPDKREGTILLSLKQIDSNHFCLVVADDGIGMPSPPKFGKEKSLGMQLIPAFIAQLQAEFTFDSTVGTRYELKIPLSQGG